MRPLIVPGRTTLLAATALCPLLLAAMLDPWLGAAAALADLLLIGACLIEGRTLRLAPVTVAAATPWPRLEREKAAQLGFHLHNPGRHPVRVTLRFEWPPELGVEPGAHRITTRLGPGESVLAEVPCIPARRGPLRIPPPQVETAGHLGLAQIRFTGIALPETCVRPNLTQVAAFDQLRHRQSLAQMGIHRVRRIGEGREFEQLREYMPDDEFRQIDWKATARRGEPVTALHQAEKAQDLVICLDCGRMMGAPLARGSVLDAAVDAAVMLAHAARRGGDKPGLALFGAQVKRFLSPSGSAPALARMTDELGAAQAEPIFPSYTELASFLRGHQKRRAMVFIFTDLADPQLAANLAEVMPLVARRHAVVVVSLKDTLLHATAAGAPLNQAGLYQVLAAASLEDERAARVADLTRRGVSVLEAAPEKLGIEAINAYLRLKARQMG